MCAHPTAQGRKLQQPKENSCTVWCLASLVVYAYCGFEKVEVGVRYRQLNFCCILHILSWGCTAPPDAIHIENFAAAHAHARLRKPGRRRNRCLRRPSSCRKLIRSRKSSGMLFKLSLKRSSVRALSCDARTARLQRRHRPHGIKLVGSRRL